MLTNYISSRFKFRVLCIFYDFRVKTMFGSSLLAFMLSVDHLYLFTDTSVSNTISISYDVRVVQE